MPGYLNHYRRGCELAEAAEAEYERSTGDATPGPLQASALRRCEVLAGLPRMRFEAAGAALVGADCDPIERLVEDVKDAPSPIVPFLKPRGAS